MATHRLIRFLVPLAVLSVLAAVAILWVGAGSSPASSRSQFCSPNRTTAYPGEGDGSGPPGFIAHMRAWSGTVLAGGEPAIRIVNRGGDVLYWGRQRVDRSVEGAWVRMRVPGGGPTPLVLPTVLPESITGCLGPETEASWPTGKYRWTLEVKAVGDSGPDGHHLLRAAFHLQSRH